MSPGTAVDDIRTGDIDIEIGAIEAGLAQVAGVLNVAHAQLVDQTAAALTHGGWAACGIHTPAQWLTIQMGLSTPRAKQVVAVAERIAEFPVLRAAFAAGELAFEQVHVVATCAPVWADAKVTEFARFATVPQLRRVIRDEFFDDDPEQPVEPDPQSSTGGDRCSFGWGDDGRFSLHACGDADGGSVIEDALNEARDGLFQRGDVDVTWWDALVEVCRRSMSTVSPQRRERFKTYAHYDVGTGRARLTNGVVLPAAVRDYVLCDGQMQPVWERDSIPFGVGRSQRIVPDRTRRIVEHRDQGCGVPGCTGKHVEIHHIIHWDTGGPTETWNLLSLCPKHHKLHHKGLLGISGNADVPGGVVYTDHNGRPLDRHGRPRVPTGPPPEPDIGYRHPTGERLQLRWIHWQHPTNLHPCVSTRRK